MKCPNCKNKIPKNSKFCKYCRYQLKAGKNSKGNKLHIFMISVSCCSIVVVGIGSFLFYQYWNSPNQKILRELASENYEEAVELYNSNFDEDDAPDDILETVTKMLDDEYAAFQNQEKSYSAVCNTIDTIAEMEIADLDQKVETIQESVDALNASRTAYETAESYMDDENYADAIAQYKLVIQDDSNYDTAQTRMEEAVTSYRTKVLADADEKASLGDVSDAITILKSGLNVLENDSELTQQMTTYQNQLEDEAIAMALEKAEEYAESENYESAISVVEDALNSYADDASLQAAMDTYTEAFVNDVIAQADALIDENDYSSAITKLEAAIEVVDSDVLKDQLAQTKENQPVNLTELKSQNADDFWLESNALEDVFGEIYTGDNIWKIDGGTPNSCEFYIGGNYAIFSGTIVPETYFGEDTAINFEVYIDDELEYSQKITQKTEATTFEIDVTSGQWLKIKVSEIEGEYRWSNQLILVNPVLKK